MSQYEYSFFGEDIEALLKRKIAKPIIRFFITGIYMGENVEKLAGFVLDHLGRIPKAGASFIHRNARFEVVDMDGNRIDKVLIKVGPKEDKEAPDAVMNNE